MSLRNIQLQNYSEQLFSIFAIFWHLLFWRLYDFLKSATFIEGGYYEWRFKKVNANRSMFGDTKQLCSFREEANGTAKEADEKYPKQSWSSSSSALVLEFH